MQSIYSTIISAKNNLMVNKKLIKQIGLEEAILLCELANEESYYECRDKLTDDGYFFTTLNNIEDILGFSSYKQKILFDNLTNLGIISISYRDMPAKRFVKINDKILMNYLDRPVS